MELIKSYVFEENDIKDLLFAVEVTLNYREKDFVSDLQVKRLKNIYGFLLYQLEMQEKSGIDNTQNLTPREIEICKLLIKGYSQNEISEALNITIHTVKIHAKNIYRKLNVNNKIDLILRYSRT